MNFKRTAAALILGVSIVACSSNSSDQAAQQKQVQQTMQTIQAGIVAANTVACANQASAAALIPTVKGATDQQKALAIAAACAIATAAAPGITQALATPTEVGIPAK